MAFCLLAPVAVGIGAVEHVPLSTVEVDCSKASVTQTAPPAPLAWRTWVTLLITSQRSCGFGTLKLMTLVHMQLIADGVKFTPAAMRAIGIVDTGLVMRHVLLAALCFHSYQQVPGRSRTHEQRAVLPID